MNVDRRHTFTNIDRDALFWFISIHLTLMQPYFKVNYLFLFHLIIYSNKNIFQLQFIRYIITNNNHA